VGASRSELRIKQEIAEKGFEQEDTEVTERNSDLRDVCGLLEDVSYFDPVGRGDSGFRLMLLRWKLMVRDTVGIYRQGIEVQFGQEFSISVSCSDLRDLCDLR